MSKNIIDITEFYGDKEMRWFQIASKNEAIAALQESIRRILIVQPTGCGKTLTIVASLSDPEFRKALGVIGDRPLRVLFVAHTHRLLTQAEQTFVTDSNVDLKIQSMFSPIPDEVIEEGWDVAILDEAHHESCLTFQYQLEHINHKPIIGLTATPDRADGCLIKFERIIEPISRVQAVKEGWLAETELNSFIDTPKRDKTEILMDILTHYGNQFGQTMVFCRTKREVRIINDFLCASGYVSVAILNQTKNQLDNLLNDFSAGKVQFLVNCNKINEGVDVKGCTDVLLGRQFGSYPQLNQVIGRAARPDSACRVWELINPISGYNLDTTVVVGTPKIHRLIAKLGGKWTERNFDYTSHTGDTITSGVRMGV